MAEQIAPTRSNLLQRRDQLRLANRGADLLKRKRDALIGEFFGLVKESLAARRALNETSKEAYFSLFLAKAWDGPEAVESLSLAEGKTLEVALTVENLFGVKVPQVQPPEFSNELPFSPVNAGARTLDAAAQFRKLTEAIIQVAATETRLRLVGEEIKKTSRRVNALEQIVIPNIGVQIKQIRSVLEQRALEEITVLKRIKAKLDAREEADAEAALSNGAVSDGAMSSAPVETPPETAETPPETPAEPEQDEQTAEAAPQDESQDDTQDEPQDAQTASNSKRRRNRKKGSS